MRLNVSQIAPLKPIGSVPFSNKQSLANYKHQHAEIAFNKFLVNFHFCNRNMSYLELPDESISVKMNETINFMVKNPK